MNRNEKILQMKVVVVWKMMLVVIYFTSAILIFFSQHERPTFAYQIRIKEKDKKKRGTQQKNDLRDIIT